MNIGVIFTAEKRSGGTYQYSLSLLEALKLIKQHTYFIFNFSPDFAFTDFNLENWKIIDFYSKKNKNSPEKTHSNWKQLVLKLLDFLKLYKLKLYLIEKNSRKKVKFFYKHDLDLIIHPLISEFSYLVKIPSIISVHDLQHRLNPRFPEVSKGGQYVFREHFYKNALKIAKYILVDSEIGKEDVINCYGLSAEKVIVLPFVPFKKIDGGISNKGIKEFLDENNLPQKFIFYPAQFWPHKNHQNLIKALAILKKKNIIVPIVLVGSKREEWNEFERIRKIVKDNQMDNQVYYLGYVSNRELGVLYKSALALVMPTFFGPTNIPVIEAWEAGCPVLYSDIRGCREQAGDAALLFNPKDPENIADKIRMVWENKDLREALVEKGKKRYNKWNQKDFNEKIKQIINNFEKEKNAQ